jgi:aminoglycoside 6'-N-acetyltransferase
VDDADGALRIVGDRVVVRSVSDADLPSLEAVMSCPGVRQWWWDFDIGEFAVQLRDDDVRPLVVEHAEDVVGYMQYAEQDSRQYHFASIDLALHDRHQGLGYGSDAVRVLARYLFATLGHHRVTIDPAVANERAIRCYERVGFRRVGVMRQYERGADGAWHDGLLMELLASDLR